MYKTTSMISIESSRKW